MFLLIACALCLLIVYFLCFVQAIPRTVVFDTKTRTNLLQWPVEEVESLRSESYDFENLKLEPGSVLPLNIGSATQVYHHVPFLTLIFDVKYILA